MTPFELAVPRRLKAARLLPSDGPDAPPRSAGGYDDGFAAGYREGRWKAELEARRQRERLEQEAGTRLRALEQIHDEMLAIVREHLPQLVLAAVTRLFRHHHFKDEEIFAEVRSLLEELAHARSIAIECAPGDLDALRDQIAELGLPFGQAGLEWRANPSLLPGEYIIQSDLGSVDGRRLSKLKQLRLALEPTSESRG